MSRACEACQVAPAPAVVGAGGGAELVDLCETCLAIGHQHDLVDLVGVAAGGAR